MKATIMGYDEFTKESFSYVLRNVVMITKTLGIITIQYIEDGCPIVTSYRDSELKIVIEN